MRGKLHAANLPRRTRSPSAIQPRFYVPTRGWVCRTRLNPSPRFNSPARLTGRDAGAKLPGMKMRLPRIAAAGVSVAAMCALAGCRDPSAPSDYKIVHASVDSLRPDTFELLARPSDPIADKVSAEPLACLFTADTEVYINDRLVDFERLAPGDTVELVGYFESTNPRGRRFIVWRASARRDEPAPLDLIPMPLIELTDANAPP